MDPTPKLRILALAALAASVALAQPPASRPLVFDVATVRPAKAQRGAGIFFTPDGARANGSPLKYIIRSAYGENRDALWFDEPAWTDTALYDIEAKFDPTAFKDLTDEQRRAVMQALLADRFKLVVHRETRVLPLYNLVVAKGGPKLRVADASEYLVDDSSKPYCRAGLTNFRQCSMAEFAKFAPSLLAIDRIIDDKTGLTGRYDFELYYTRAGSGMDSSPDAVSIFDALPEQIGLKLEPAKESFDVFVIDHIERPSEN